MDQALLDNALRSYLNKGILAALFRCTVGNAYIAHLFYETGDFYFVFERTEGYSPPPDRHGPTPEHKAAVDKLKTYQAREGWGFLLIEYSDHTHSQEVRLSDIPGRFGNWDGQIWALKTGLFLWLDGQLLWPIPIVDEGIVHWGECLLDWLYCYLRLHERLAVWLWENSFLQEG